MARNTECLVIAIDVSPSVKWSIQGGITYISERINEKLLFNPKDEVAIISFGCNESNNSLHEEMGGYEHVSVIQPLRLVDTDIYASLKDIKPGQASGDFINAIVVAMDMLVREKGTMRKGNKRILVITDAASPLQPPCEGSSMADQMSAITDRMTEQGVKTDAILLQKGSMAAQRVKAEESQLSNQELLDAFCCRTGGDLTPVPDLGCLLARVRPRVSPTTSYRGDFEVTPFFNIKVYVYKKTLQQKFPSLKMYSERSPAGDLTATRQVRYEREFKLSTSEDVQVAPDQQVKAYKYGPQMVPISDIDRETLMFKADKGFKLIGFTSRENVPRHYFMRDVSMVLPEPANEESAVAISALVRAMEASGKVAIVRFKMIARRDLGVTVGVLSPLLAQNDSMVDSFLLNCLPFAEDIREFPFLSFSDIPKEKQPTSSQLAVAEGLVGSMDLMDVDGREALIPECTPNPLLQRYYKFVQQKFLDPAAPVPALDPNLLGVTANNPPWLPQMAVLKEAFPLIEQPQKGKDSKKLWSDRLADVPPAIKDASEASTLLSDESMAAKKQEIEDLLDISTDENRYSSALKILEAMRARFVANQQWREFNDFLWLIRAKCRGRKHHNFWEMLVRSHVSLIEKMEVQASDVATEDAQRFLAFKVE